MFCLKNLYRHVLVETPVSIGALNIEYICSPCIVNMVKGNNFFACGRTPTLRKSFVSGPTKFLLNVMYFGMQLQSKWKLCAVGFMQLSLELMVVPTWGLQEGV